MGFIHHSFLPFVEILVVTLHTFRKCERSLPDRPLKLLHILSLAEVNKVLEAASPCKVLLVFFSESINVYVRRIRKD